MCLAPGSYTIRSATGFNPFIGISFIDPAPEGRRRIVTLPDQHITLVQMWTIYRSAAQEYFLTVQGESTCIDSSLVYALCPDDPIEQWRLENVPQYGPNQYLIKTGENNTLGWVLPSDVDDTQVTIGQIVANPPTTQRFIIEGPLSDLD